MGIVGCSSSSSGQSSLSNVTSWRALAAGLRRLQTTYTLRLHRWSHERRLCVSEMVTNSSTINNSKSVPKCSEKIDPFQFSAVYK